MKKIIGYSTENIKAVIRQGIPGFLFLFLIISFLGLAVGHRYFINPGFYLTEGGGHPYFRFTFYTFAYLVSILLVVFFFNKWAQLKKLEFWTLSFVILLVVSLNQFYTFFPDCPDDLKDFDFITSLRYNLQCVFTYSAAPLIFWYFRHRKIHPDWKIYGWPLSRSAIKPYITMLLLMTPLLVWAAFRQDFQLEYPRYKPGIIESYSGVSPVLTVSAFEISYAAQFIALEWFFRGFMVLGLSRFLGNHAVWPMAVLYVFLHFGKPMHETIGSFFGGFILGNAVLNTKSVAGGIIIHIGIAWLMELLAYVI